MQFTKISTLLLAACLIIPAVLAVPAAETAGTLQIRKDGGDHDGTPTDSTPTKTTDNDDHEPTHSHSHSCVAQVKKCDCYCKKTECMDKDTYNVDDCIKATSDCDLCHTGKKTECKSDDKSADSFSKGESGNSTSSVG